MKKTVLAKLLCATLIASSISTNLTFPVSAQSNAEEIIVSDTDIEIEEWKETHEIDASEEAENKIGAISQAVTKLNGKMTNDESSLPVSFNAADMGWLTPKKQQIGGTCEAYAAISCIETSMLKNGLYSDASKLDLSEKYPVRSFGYAKVENGYAFKRMMGITFEENCPTTENWDGNTEIAGNNIRYPECAYLTDMQAEWKYNKERMKELIYKYGSVSIAYNTHQVQLYGWNDETKRWNVKDSDSSNLYTRPYDWPEIHEYLAYNVESAENHDNSYDLKRISESTKNSIYRFSPNQNGSKQETLDSFALTMYQYSDEPVSEQISVQLFTDVKDPEHPEDGTPVLPSPYIMNYDITTFHEEHLPSPLSVSPGEEVYILVDGFPLDFFIRTSNTDTEGKDTITISENAFSFTELTHPKKINVLSGNNVTFTSLDTKVAKVSSDGTVTPVAGGTTFIKVSNGEDAKYCKITVTLSILDTTVTIEPVTYSGSALYPEITVSVNGVPLIFGTDYTWGYGSKESSHEANRDAGKGSVTICGLGYYRNLRTDEFTISPLSADNIAVADNIVYNSKNEYSFSLNYQGSYPLGCTASAVHNFVGAQTIRVKGAQNFTGTAEVTRNIVSQNIPYHMIKLEFDSNDDIRYSDPTKDVFKYNKNGVYPKVKVSIKDSQMSEFTELSETEYTLTYYNNDDIWLNNYIKYDPNKEPYVMVDLKNNYSGSSKISFEINGQKEEEPEEQLDYTLTNATWEDANDNVVYNGASYTIDPVIKVEGRTLVKGTDYTIYYKPFNQLIECKELTTPGTYTIYAYGKGKYNSQTYASHTYTISKADISNCTVKAIEDQDYTGEAIEPQITLLFNGQEYTKMNYDMDIRYSNNVNPGTATVEVEIPNFFNGVKTATFVIKGQSEPTPDPTPEPTPTPDPDPTPEPTPEPEKPVEEQVESKILVKSEKITLPYTGKLISTNAKVATVNKKGLVTAKKAGECDIKTTDGKIVCHIKVEQPVFKKSLIIVKDLTEAITYSGTTLPVTYTGYKSQVVEVDANGTVKGLKKGNTKINAIIHGVKYPISVKVIDLKLSKTKLEMKPAKKLSLTLSGGYKGTVTWTSSDTSVITVSEKGKLAALTSGTAVITADIGQKKFTCEVTVQNPHFEKKKVTLKVGDTYQLKVLDGIGEPSYQSSKMNIAEVDQNGCVTAKAKGTTKVTASVNGKKAIVTIAVKN